jgi:hypothetical protein
VTALLSVYAQETVYLRLAREIAMDHNSIETILNNHQINSNEYERIKEDPRFQRMLAAEIEAWNSAGNTLERTKLKAGALIEEWLPEANARIHDRSEALNAKSEIVKTLVRIAGMGLDRANIEGAAGEKFSVTINLGGDQKLQFQHQVTPKVIDGEIVKES